ncbi:MULTISPECIES: hypothetical protein [Gordonia]|uniref:hypothetical protein n=1 Tax=Gordonia TaxID=2053 RepID=UPI00257F7213|nr:MULTISPECIES: hypothetical protein [Gordonia]
MSDTNTAAARVDVVGDITTITTEAGARLDLTATDLLTLAPALYGLARFCLVASPLDEAETAERLQALDAAVQASEIEWGALR